MNKKNNMINFLLWFVVVEVLTETMFILVSDKNAVFWTIYISIFAVATLCLVASVTKAGGQFPINIKVLMYAAVIIGLGIDIVISFAFRVVFLLNPKLIVVLQLVLWGAVVVFELLLYKVGYNIVDQEQTAKMYRGRIRKHNVKGE